MHTPLLLPTRPAISKNSKADDRSQRGFPMMLAAASVLFIAAPHASAQAPVSTGTVKVPVVFSEGHDTDPRDRGRPVVLVAGALGVAPEVFREAFSGVHPAGPNSGGPTHEEAQKNKAAL